MQYKLLTKEYYLDVVKLVMESPSRHIKPRWRMLQNYYFDDTDLEHNAFGAIDEHGILVACLLTDLSAYDRSWFIRYAAKMPGTQFNIVTSTIAFAIDFAESRNFYRFYACYLNNDAKLWERKLRQWPRFYTYNRQTEEIIPINTNSSFKRYWEDFQDYRTTDKQITVREYALQSRYRSFPEV